MDEFRRCCMIMAILMSAAYQSAIAVSGPRNCKKPPTIENADHNTTDTRYNEGTEVQFYCQEGYRIEGNRLYICSNSTWVGGHFSCIKTCPFPVSPTHGKKIGDNYDVGSVVRYECNVGYKLIGSNKSQCGSDSQWHPPNVQECQIKKCRTPVIEHGELIPENKIEGSDYYSISGATLRVQCNPGFMINGSKSIYCDLNGQWTQIPECTRISCPPHPGLDAKCVRKTRLTKSTLLIVQIFCTDDSTLISAYDEHVTCENNTWSDLKITCFCDCEIKADTDFVHIENLNTSGRFKHNETLQWSCKNGSTKTTNDSLTCIDGLIKPQGWGCFIPSHTTVDPFDGKVKIGLIVGGCILLAAVATFILVCCVLKRRREKTNHQALTVSETVLKKVTATIQENTQCDGAELLEHSQGDETGAPLLSHDAGARAQNEMSREVDKTFENATREISGVASGDHLSGREEEKSTLTPVSTVQQNINRFSPSAANSRGNTVCPKCKKAVSEADVLFKDERYHKACLRCHRCKKQRPFYLDHNNKPYCEPCYDMKFGKKSVSRRATKELQLDDDDVPKPHE